MSAGAGIKQSAQALLRQGVNYMSDLRMHYQKVRNVLWIVLALNWAVAAAKIIYGLKTSTESMTADGFHSLSDGSSNLIGLLGIRFCSKPKDEGHPYGHKKYETLFALGIAGMLIMVALNLGREGIERIFNPITPQVDIVSFSVMLITLTVNIFVMRYEFKRGKQLQSDILVVDSMHTRADIFTSLTVIVSLIASKLGFPVIDPIVTLVIAGFIAFSAFMIIREESGILCDASALSDNDAKKIEEVVRSIEGVRSCHKIRSRGRLDDVFIDLHVQVEGNMSMLDAHQLSHVIQTKIMQAFPQIVDVIVHMEPSMEKNK